MRVTALEIRRRESDRMGVMATWPGWSIVAHTSGVQSQSRVTLEAPAQAELRPNFALPAPWLPASPCAVNSQNRSSKAAMRVTV
jgi:hypothetical protein